MSPLAHLARLSIRAYQLVVSPLLGPRCRFLPSCSEYAAEAVTQHGAVKGGWLAVRRIVRCHPWGGMGYDPVPPGASKDAPVPSSTCDHSHPIGHLPRRHGAAR